tara:strand:- start:24 stop:641 length:618 start_codon:yes stop_codon:yes gene_type:complete
MIKIDPRPIEEFLPLWKGKLEYPITAKEITEQTEWSDIAENKFMLTEPTGDAETKILDLLDYFNSEKFLEDLPLKDIADQIYTEWPIEQIADINYLKKILATSVSIEKNAVGRQQVPFNDNRLTFGKIIVNLSDYLLTPPMFFTSNMDWPATDVIYEHDFDFLDALFFLNSQKFYYGTQNNSKRDSYFLVCDLTLEPLFLVDRDS